MEVKEPSAKYLARPRYEQTDVGVVPKDWELKPLGKLYAFQNGVNADKSAYGSGVPFINVLEVITHSTLTENRIPGRVSLSAEAIERFSVRYGDVLFNRTSETQEEVGLTSVYVGAERVVFGGFVIRARPRDASMEAAFAAYALRSPLVRSQIVARGQGAVRANIGQQDLNGVHVVLPRKSEQERIAEALGDADSLIESLEQLLAKKRQIKHGATQELLTGKRRLPGFGGEWARVQFGEVAQPRRERIDPRRTGPQEFCIELEHIEQATGRLVGYAETSPNASLKSVFLEGDVLFGKLRAYLRKYWLATRQGVCSTEIWALVAKRSVLIPEFLFQLVSADRFIEAASSAYGTHMPRSDWSVVKRYEVRLPPLAEQTAIGGILGDVDAQISALETDLGKARQLKQGMMQELLTGKTRLLTRPVPESPRAE